MTDRVKREGLLSRSLVRLFPLGSIFAVSFLQSTRKESPLFKGGVWAYFPVSGWKSRLKSEPPNYIWAPHLFLSTSLIGCNLFRSGSLQSLIMTINCYGCRVFRLKSRRFLPGCNDCLSSFRIHSSFTLFSQFHF